MGCSLPCSSEKCDKERADHRHTANSGVTPAVKSPSPHCESGGENRGEGREPQEGEGRAQCQLYCIKKQYQKKLIKKKSPSLVQGWAVKSLALKSCPHLCTFTRGWASISIPPGSHLLGSGLCLKHPGIDSYSLHVRQSAYTKEAPTVYCMLTLPGDQPSSSSSPAPTQVGLNMPASFLSSAFLIRGTMCVCL